MGFTSFGLSDRIMQGIRAEGFTAPTPIQALAITPALAGKDIIGCAQTGTGKTAAFVLPILHRLSEQAPPSPRSSPRALVLSPTRELAQQICAATASYGRFLSLRTVSIYGGASMETQITFLHRGADIVVATPGRLLDLLQRRAITLSQIQVLVLDEADRMLDMGFIQDVRKIVAALPAKRQTLLFSATLSGDINDLAGSILHEPVLVETGERRNPLNTITQHFYATPANEKMNLLLHALQAEAMESVLVFSRTKHGADKIARRLERQGVATATIHSNRSQPQRERALHGFRDGKFRVLVATDIAARGIDVAGITHVINYDVPHQAEDYVHRIGRTGRAGVSGDAITFVGNDETDRIRDIERYIGTRLSVKSYPGFTAHLSPPRAQALSHSTPSPVKPRGHGSPAQRGHVPQGARLHNGRQRRAQTEAVAPRKKKPARQTDVYVSGHSGAAWSNF